MLSNRPCWFLKLFQFPPVIDYPHLPVVRKRGEVLCFLLPMCNFWASSLHAENKFLVACSEVATLLAVYRTKWWNLTVFVQRLCGSRGEYYVISIRGHIESCSELCSCWCPITKSVTQTLKSWARIFINNFILQNNGLQHALFLHRHRFNTMGNKRT